MDRDGDKGASFEVGGVTETAGVTGRDILRSIARAGLWVAVGDISGFTEEGVAIEADLW